ncbi:MAG: EpsG family protein [Paludibacteraceae bacterium]|nr:EpsG family protein [Paludibacteraceae bacterium]MBQ6962939.1 EpsG family protein [Paludibacteraceae bacterium]
MLLLALYFISFLAVDYISKHINGYSQKRYFQIIACFILLFVFFGMRGLSVLNDTAHYYAHLYNHLRYQSYFDESIFTPDPHDRFEYGYLVWIHFITKYIWCDPYSIILISAFIVTVANLMLVKKHTDRIALTIFLMLSTLITEYGLLRQSYAICLSYLAMNLLMERKFIKYYILIAIAYMFHHSVIIMALFPVFSFVELNKDNVIRTFIATIIISVCIFPIISMLGFGESAYYEGNQDREAAPIAAMINAAMYIFVAYAGYYLHKKFKSDLPQPLIIWAVICGLCLSIINISFLSFNRLALYFIPYITIFFIYTYESCTAQNPNNKKIKTILLIIILAILGKMILTIALKNIWHHLTPYSMYDFYEEFHNYNFGY